MKLGIIQPNATFTAFNAPLRNNPPAAAERKTPARVCTGPGRALTPAPTQLMISANALIAGTASFKIDGIVWKF
ncbi:MAG: hypothetical protein QMC92_08185 [Methanothermobacter wolfeii]|nr:hypothetical protein [Methanothermobacter wolfeii]